GRPPYEGPTLMAILLQHRDGAIPSLCAARAEIPHALDQAFQRMVAKKPAERFATMAEAVHALEHSLVAPELPARAPELHSATVAFVPSADAGMTLLPEGSEPARQTGPATVEMAQAQSLTNTTANQTINLAPAGKSVTGGATILLVEPSRV